MQTCRPSSSCAPSAHEYARDSQRWRTLWWQVRTSHLKMFGRNRSTGLLFKVFNKFPIKYGAFALFSTELLLFLQTTIGYSVMLFTQNFLHTYTESSYNLQLVSESDNDSLAVMMYLNQLRICQTDSNLIRIYDLFTKRTSP